MHCLSTKIQFHMNYNFIFFNYSTLLAILVFNIIYYSLCVCVCVYIYYHAYTCKIYKNLNIVFCKLENWKLIKIDDKLKKKGGGEVLAHFMQYIWIDYDLHDYNFLTELFKVFFQCTENYGGKKIVGSSVKIWIVYFFFNFCFWGGGGSIYVQILFSITNNNNIWKSTN